MDTLYTIVLYLSTGFSQNLETLMSNPTLRSDDCLKLALIYAIRHEAQGRADIDRLDRILVSRGIDETERKVGSVN